MGSILDRIREEAEKEKQQKQAQAEAAAKKSESPSSTVGSMISYVGKLAANERIKAAASPSGEAQPIGANDAWKQEKAQLETAMTPLKTKLLYEAAGMAVGQDAMADLERRYQANPSNDLVDAYNQRVGRYNSSLDAYKGYASQYDEYATQYSDLFSSARYKERIEDLAQKVEEAERAKSQAYAVMRDAEIAASYTGGYVEDEDAYQQAYDTANAEYENLKQELDDLTNQYYYVENREKQASLAADPTMSGHYQNVQDIQSDIDKVMEVMGYYSPSRTGDPALVEEYEAYLLEKYGLDQQAIKAYSTGGATSPGGRRDDGGYHNIYDLYQELLDQQEASKGELAGAGYDYSRMSGYEQMLEDAKAYKAKQAEWEAYAKEHPFWASVDTVLVAPFSGVEYLKETVGAIGHSDTSDPDSYVPMNVYNMDTTNYVSAVRETVSKEIEESTDWELFGQNVASFLYNTGMSVADSAVQVAAFGKASTIFMGMSSASSQAKNIIERGGTNQQAITGGLAAGAAEMLFERFSVESLLDIKNISGWRAVLESTVKQMGVEASEETFTEIANILTDAAIMGDKSEFEMTVKQYMAAGKSREEAEELAFLDAVGQVAWAGAGGALSGGVTGGGKATISALSGHYVNRDIGADMSSLGEDVVQAMIETGLESEKGTESRRLAEQLEKKTKAGETITDAEIGALQRANEMAIARENPVLELAREKVAEDAAAETGDAPVLTAEGLAAEKVKRDERVAQLKAETEEKAKTAIPYNVVRTDRDASSGLKKLGYGTHGTSAFETVLEETGMTVEQAKYHFDTAYEAGLTNTPANKLTLGNDIQKAAFAAGLRDYGATQKELAERSNRWAEYTSVATKKKAGFRYDPANLPSGMTQEEADTIDLLGKVFGTTIRMGKLSNANAQITASGEVILDYDYQRSVGGEERNAVFYALHEIGMHRLMQVAPDAGQAFINATIRQKNADLPDHALTETQGKQGKYAKGGVNLTIGKAMEEVSADSIFRLYRNDTAAVKQMLESVAKGKNEKAKEGAREYKGVLDWLITKLKNLWNKLRGKGENQAAAEVKAAIDDLTELRKLFEDALRVAAERVKAEQKNPTNKTANEAGRTDDGSGIMLSAKAQRGRSIELETMENNRFERLRRFRGDLPSEWYAFTGRYFYIYSNQSFMDYTILVKASLTEKNKEAIYLFVEGLENVAFEPAETFDQWTSYFRRGKGRHSWDRVHAGVRGTTVRSDGVDERAQRGKHVGHSEKDGGNGERLIEPEDGIQYSLVEDEETLDFLNNQKQVKVYRAMQEIDGKLYPPMAALIKGQTGKKQLVEDTKKGAWYQADEHPELIKLDKNGRPKFELNKGNGGMVPAAYNPYFHTSASPLNDQFSSAFDRPNIVVVEGYIPESELTSGYKAEYAKDSVGETAWHAGPVASKLKGAKARRVFLSRWFKAERVVPVNEVAKTIAKTLEGESVRVLWKGVRN